MPKATPPISKTTVSTALFGCVRCGYEANADHVGAIDVLERGQRLFACGEGALSGHSKKQEPAEAAQALGVYVQ
jgi:putative transposase